MRYVSFRQRMRMPRFLLHAGYFRASRYGKFLLSNVENVGYKSSQDGTFYMKKEYYAPSRGERDTKKRKTNIKYFESVFYDDIVRKEEKLIKKSSVDIYTLKILPEQWEILYDEIREF